MNTTTEVRSEIPPATTGTAVPLASSRSDAAAVEAVEAHHAQLAGALATHVEAVLTAVAAADDGALVRARDRLVGFCTTELLPHAAAEEGTLYPAAAVDPRARLLVEAMIAEH
ncbi:MAG TPA: hemerythrin domain-containing protein, partial [Candidatus Nanopelagicales bacterium]|nr:hemerythrin domain-containing protein [Candidatus Nanopelagicales bacterium]